MTTKAPQQRSLDHQTRSRETDGKKRVGIIEIGSRATRLLIADIDKNDDVKPALTRVEDTQLMEAAERGEQAVQNELVNISRVVTRFRAQATRIGMARCFVFGTEAIRQIAGKSIFINSPLAALVDEILDDRAEAECSLIAGIMGLRAARLTGKTAFVIDQGAGSTELSTGECGPPVRLLDFASLKCGGNSLLKTLREVHRDIASFTEAVRPTFDACRLPIGEADNVVVQGTVATKCAWLIERNNLTEKYDPRRVHGKRLKTEALVMLVSAVQRFSPKQWIEFQNLVNPGEPGGDAGERLASGVIPLLHIMQRMKKKEFIVSAYGTRHGMGLRLVQSKGVES